MTLSDRKTKKRIAKNFVCTWGNVDGERFAGESFAHRPSDAPASCIRGNGEHNMQLLVLTPEGELLSAMAGYLAPDALAEELDLALGLWKDTEKLRKSGQAKGPHATARADVVRRAHERFSRAFAKRELDGTFGRFIRNRVLADHGYVAKNALMDARAFRPESMVGNAKTFFGGYSGGKKPGRIGGQKKRH